MLRLLHICCAVLGILLLAGCGAESGRFRIEGRLRNMNQAEFWVYSPDGVITGIDTIRVKNGRFAYETDVSDAGTLLIIFPNYSEQPVFAQPGGKVTVKGDATLLKELIIEGTSDNEDMTTLRMELNDLTPPDIPSAVSKFITSNPKSQVSIYLLRRYFIQSREPDYQQALRLTRLMLEKDPDNGRLLNLKKQLARLQGAPLKGQMPVFTAKDVKGRRVTEGQLRADINMVYTWATWSYQSTSLQSQLIKLKERHGARLSLLGICLDGSVYDCKQRVRRDSLPWPILCDGLMWESPLLSKFGLADVPDNVIIDKRGRVVARSVPKQQLEERISKLLKD